MRKKKRKKEKKKKKKKKERKRAKRLLGLPGAYSIDVELATIGIFQR